jgi:hypothetical protein
LTLFTPKVGRFFPESVPSFRSSYFTLGKFMGIANEAPFSNI